MSLSVRLGGIPIGALSRDADGGLVFQYDGAFPDAARAHRLPSMLSLSMPFRAEPYTREANAFFAGLLPEAPSARRNLGRQLGLDEGDDFGLLDALGRELPGAVSVVSPSTPVMPDRDAEFSYARLEDAHLDSLLGELRGRPLMVDADGEMRLSLAGVHDKTALLRLEDGTWAIPRGQTPSSHIIKVDIDGLPDSIVTEQFCLELASRAGLKVPRSGLRQTWSGRVYMAIARYDRFMVADGSGRRTLRRLHQEDFTQAYAVLPTQKYEKDGGPGWAQMFAMLDRTTNPLLSRGAMLDAMLFQFLVGNPDAHAKNYSLLIRENEVALSPLYDINNAAAFRDRFKTVRERMAMAIGGERNPSLITREHFVAFAAETGLSDDVVIRRLEEMSATLPGIATGLRTERRGAVGDSALLDVIVADIDTRCHRFVAPTVSYAM